MKVNPNIRNLSPYQPGRPIDEVARELGLRKLIKLASNENPHGPSPLALEVIDQGLAQLSRYPDGAAFDLKYKLSEHLNIESEQVTVGNGSNDILDLVARCALRPGAEAIISEHAFIVYKLATISAGGHLVEVPARNYGTDLSAMLRAVTEKTAIIFLANPNNPTGTYVDSEELQGFLDHLPDDIWVVLDEAYAEYVSHASYPDGIKLLGRYPNLIVTRTFSKIYGLAGLRVGYSVSSAKIADLMNRVRQPFNVNSLGMASAAAALSDKKFVAQSKRFNDDGMKVVCDCLMELGIPYIPSVGNFISFDTGGPAIGVYEQLLKKGFILRPIGEYGLPDFLRVTIGTEEENREFLDVLPDVMGVVRKT